MSRIKGTYLLLTAPALGPQDRWLDPQTGMAYYDARSGRIAVSTPFAQQADGTWVSPGGYTFIEDTPPVPDWYVLRFIPEGMFCGEKRPASTLCEGPYKENVARTKVVGYAKSHRGPDCKMAVVQLTAGNLFSKTTPPTPAPEFNWS